MEAIPCDPMSKPLQISVRIPQEWLDRLDQVARAMSRPGTEASRAEAIRFLVARGFEAAEKELGIKPPPVSKPTSKKA
jgi:predicted transcriptional regulator